MPLHLREAERTRCISSRSTSQYTRKSLNLSITESQFLQVQHSSSHLKRRYSHRWKCVGLQLPRRRRSLHLVGRRSNLKQPSIAVTITVDT
ncbi:hypothetical protein PENANT_c019G04951 [Penicillium antarcticum]|uniref:Uncharacterized protein n=1 Tax=Penicillium antarcticum TaxID=416450 RepID=A0A1V6Q0M7_9EURO|nr:hypothetical protein PENANT_c019G04951 [Penicillium antarcticum]